MEDILNNLYRDIVRFIDENKDVQYHFENIKSNTLCIGSGGSKVVATFVARVLEKKNHIICKVGDATDAKLTNMDSILVCSYSGSNYGVKYALDTNKDKYLLSSRKTRISKEELLHYDLEDEKSFISLRATVMPMALLLKYYLGSDFDKVLKEIFANIDYELCMDIDEVINIFTSSSSSTACAFLESSLMESGICIPLVHTKYDYCHGRSTINKSHENSAILFSESKEIDEVLESIMHETMKEYSVISSPFTDTIVMDFYNTIESLYLLYNIARKKNVDLRKIDYDRIAVGQLYYFKGSM